MIPKAEPHKSWRAKLDQTQNLFFQQSEIEQQYINQIYKSKMEGKCEQVVFIERMILEPISLQQKYLLGEMEYLFNEKKNGKFNSNKRNL